MLSRQSSTIWWASVAVVFNVCATSAYDNGMALKPPLGWQTWCSAGPCGTDHCFDFQIRETAKAMSENGMKEAGYEWIVLDDCWHPSRPDNGTLVPFPEFFPNGMQPVIDYVHSLGLKFGLYTSVGDKTCHGGWSPGSYGHYETDANTFASWGVDYVKMDYCGDHDSPEGHKEFSEAMNKTGRPMILELCRGPYQDEPEWGYAPSVAQVWRATVDHHDNFESTMNQVAHMSGGRGKFSGPHGWAYGDMMMTGGQGCALYDPHKPKHCQLQTDNEYRTEVSLYSVLSSPMMIGTDIRDMTSIMNETLLNRDMLAINQDYKAVPGTNVSSCGKQAWVRHLSNGNVAVAIPNLDIGMATMSVCFKDIGWTGGNTAHVRNVWKKSDEGVFTGQYTVDVETHDTALVILSPSV
eukprot:m.390962 g.390962  ORF g.390962 m.390962 type:complete len:408 (-) comp21066_c0_seq2:315-1538(-)